MSLLKHIWSDRGAGVILGRFEDGRRRLAHGQGNTMRLHDIRMMVQLTDDLDGDSVIALGRDSITIIPPKREVSQ